MRAWNPNRRRLRRRRTAAPAAAACRSRRRRRRRGRAPADAACPAPPAADGRRGVPTRGRLLALRAGGAGRGRCRSPRRASAAPPPPTLAAAPAAAAAGALRLGRHRLVERREHLGRRPEAQRRIRHAQHVGALRDLDLHVRRHARLQLQLGFGTSMTVP